MAPEGAATRFAQRAVLEVPGAKSALKRTITHTLASGTRITIPDMESALSLKGAAMSTATPNKIRHLQDATVLFACLPSTGPANTSKSMRSNINRLIAGLESPAPWSATPLEVRLRALTAIQSIRPGWKAPWQGSTDRYRSRTG